MLQLTDDDDDDGFLSLYGGLQHIDLSRLAFVGLLVSTRISRGKREVVWKPDVGLGLALTGD